MAPNGARRIFAPTNPDLADILGRTDLDFENVYFLVGFGTQFFRSPDKPVLGDAAVVMQSLFGSAHEAEHDF